MVRRQIVAVYRLGFGLLVLVALAATHVSLRPGLSFNIVNFLSFFTNLSNLYAASLFLYLALSDHGTRAPARALQIDLLRGAAVVFLLITGVVYNTMLSGQPAGVFASPANAVVHLLMPIAIVADWLIDPPWRRLAIGQTMWWLVFPLVFVVSTEVRGAVMNWYPYWFLDPAHAGGLGGVLAYCGPIMSGTLATIILVTWLGNARSRSRAFAHNLEKEAL